MFRTNNWSSSSGFLYSSLHNFTTHIENSLVTDTIPMKNVKWTRYRPGVAQRVGRGIALLFHDWDTRRWWVVSSTLRPHFTPGKDSVPILQEAGWPGRTENLVPTGIRSPDRPVSRYTDWATRPTTRYEWFAKKYCYRISGLRVTGKDWNSQIF